MSEKWRVGVSKANGIAWVWTEHRNNLEVITRITEMCDKGYSLFKVWPPKVPQKHEVWMNFHRYLDHTELEPNGPFFTKEDADRLAFQGNYKRVACVRVEFEEGEGLQQEDRHE